MSSREMTKIAAAAWEVFCSFLETEDTSMFIKSSRLVLVRSGVCPEQAGSPWKVIAAITENTRSRLEIRVENAAQKRSTSFCEQLQERGPNFMLEHPRDADAFAIN